LQHELPFQLFLSLCAAGSGSFLLAQESSKANKETKKASLKRYEIIFQSI
jgi:hypothetical protein